MDLCTTTRLLILYIITIHKLKWIYCSDENPDDTDESDDNNQSSDKNPSDTDKGLKKETRITVVKTDGKEVGAVGTLIIANRIPKKLDIEKRESSLEFNCVMHEDCVIFTASPKHCFHLFYSRREFICTLNLVHCANQVIVKSEGEAKILKIHLLDGTRRTYRKTGKKTQWECVMPEPTDIGEHGYHYYVKLTDIGSVKAKLKKLKLELNTICVDSATLGHFKVMSQAFKVERIVESLLGVYTLREASITTGNLINALFILESYIGITSNAIKFSLHGRYNTFELALKRFFQNVQVYKIEIEPGPEEEPSQPPEPERIELEIEDDDDGQSPTKQQDKDKDAESKDDEDDKDDDKGKKGKKKKKKKLRKHKPSKKSLPNINLYTLVGENNVELLENVGYAVEYTDEGVKYIINDEVACTLVMLDGEVVWKHKRGPYPLSILYLTETGLVTIEFERKTVKLTKVDGVWVK